MFQSKSNFFKGRNRELIYNPVDFVGYFELIRRQKTMIFEITLNELISYPEILVRFLKSWIKKATSRFVTFLIRFRTEMSINRKVLYLKSEAIECVKLWEFKKIKFNKSDESRIHRIHQKVRTWTGSFKSNFSKQRK